VNNFFAAKAFLMTERLNREPFDAFASYDIFVDPLNSSGEEIHEYRHSSNEMVVADVTNVNVLAVTLAYNVVPSMTRMRLKAEELRADTFGSAVHSKTYVRIRAQCYEKTRLSC
jgi:hypothetical protein